jgi:hypothetical protein
VRRGLFIGFGLGTLIVGALALRLIYWFADDEEPNPNLAPLA